MRRRPRNSAFTLVEVAVAIVIVGVGSVALMQLAMACTLQSRAAADVTTAAMLAQHVQEMLADLPLCDPTVGPANFGDEAGETLAGFDDVDDFDEQTFSPPIDSGRVVLAGVGGYAQRVSVFPINPRRLNGNANGTELARTTASYTGAVRVRVRVLRNDPTTGTPATAYELEWVRVED